MLRFQVNGTNFISAGFGMTADDLARRVAKNLTSELGPETTTSTEAAISGEKSRSWGEAAHIGGFILTACRFAWEIYKDYKTLPELKSAVVAHVEKPAGLSSQKVEAIVDEVVDQLMEVKG